MKNLIATLILSVFLGNFNLQAQNKKSLSFDLTNKSSRIMYLVQKNTNISKRFFLGGDILKDDNFREINFRHNQYISNGLFRLEKKSIHQYKLGFGILKSIYELENKLEIYYGVDLVLNIKFTKYYHKNEVLDSLVFNTSPQYGGNYLEFKNANNRDYTIEKSYSNINNSLNLNPFLGFRYYVHPKISFGAEVNMNLAQIGFIINSIGKSESFIKGKHEKSSYQINASNNHFNNFSFNNTAQVTACIKLN